MKHDKFSARRRQVLALGAVSAGAITIPAMAMTSTMTSGESAEDQAGGRTVVSGRVVGATDGRALSGAQIEIWHVDPRGAVAEGTREVATADGDGRYFAVLKGNPQRLQYRVSHKDHTPKVTQLYVSGARQRAVTMTRDHAGVTRVSFEMMLAPRNMMTAAGVPDYVAL